MATYLPQRWPVSFFVFLTFVVWSSLKIFSQSHFVSVIITFSKNEHTCKCVTPYLPQRCPPGRGPRTWGLSVFNLCSWVFLIFLFTSIYFLGYFYYFYRSVSFSKHRTSRNDDWGHAGKAVVHTLGGRPRKPRHVRIAQIPLTWPLLRTGTRVLDIPKLILML